MSSPYRTPGAIARPATVGDLKRLLDDMPESDELCVSVEADPVSGVSMRASGVACTVEKGMRTKHSPRPAVWLEFKLGRPG